MMFSNVVRRWLPTVGGLLCLTALLVPVRAEDERKLGWSDVAEFSLVATNGNSDSTSLGLKNVLERKWEKASFIFRLGGIRIESDSGKRVVVCQEPTCTQFEVLEADSEVTAENFYANLRYGRDVTKRLFWYVGANWDRNPFAGIDDRYIGEAGVGNTWWDRDDLRFKTAYAATYTDQTDVIDNPAFDGKFAGLRFTWTYLNKFGKNNQMSYDNLLIIDYNADEPSDWRVDLDQGFSVTMTKMLALKVGLRLLYDNDPSLEDVTVISGGGPTISSVQVPLDEWDSIFTVGLVVNFI